MPPAAAAAAAYPPQPLQVSDAKTVELQKEFCKRVAQRILAASRRLPPDLYTRHQTQIGVLWTKLQNTWPAVRALRRAARARVCLRMRSAHPPTLPAAPSPSPQLTINERQRVLHDFDAALKATVGPELHGQATQEERAVFIQRQAVAAASLASVQQQQAVQPPSRAASPFPSSMGTPAASPAGGAASASALTPQKQQQQQPKQAAAAVHMQAAAAAAITGSAKRTADAAGGDGAPAAKRAKGGGAAAAGGVGGGGKKKEADDTGMTVDNLYDWDQETNQLMEGVPWEGVDGRGCCGADEVCSATAIDVAHLLCTLPRRQSSYLLPAAPARRPAARPPGQPGADALHGDQPAVSQVRPAAGGEPAVGLAPLLFAPRNRTLPHAVRERSAHPPSCCLTLRAPAPPLACSEWRLGHEFYRQIQRAGGGLVSRGWGTCRGAASRRSRRRCSLCAGRVCSDTRRLAALHLPAWLQRVKSECFELLQLAFQAHMTQARVPAWARPLAARCSPCCPPACGLGRAALPACLARRHLLPGHCLQARPAPLPPFVPPRAGHPALLAHRRAPPGREPAQQRHGADLQPAQRRDAD